jgi:hypothetical protein
MFLYNTAKKYTSSLLCYFTFKLYGWLSHGSLLVDNDKDKVMIEGVLIEWQVQVFDDGLSRNGEDMAQLDRKCSYDDILVLFDKFFCF